MKNIFRLFTIFTLVVSGVFVFGVTAKPVHAANLSDTFTDTSGVALQAHTSNTGNTWIKNSNTSGGGDIYITNNNRVRLNSNPVVIYNSNWLPSSADYEVKADIYYTGNPTASQQIGIGGRSGTTAFTGYYALLVGSGSSPSIYLYRGGNATPLGIHAVSINTSESHELKLSMLGNNIRVL